MRSGNSRTVGRGVRSDKTSSLSPVQVPSPRVTLASRGATERRSQRNEAHSCPTPSVWHLTPRILRNRRLSSMRSGCRMHRSLASGLSFPSHLRAESTAPTSRAQNKRSAIVETSPPPSLNKISLLTAKLPPTTQSILYIAFLNDVRKSAIMPRAATTTKGRTLYPSSQSRGLARVISALTDRPLTEQPPRPWPHFPRYTDAFVRVETRALDAFQLGRCASQAVTLILSSPSQAVVPFDATSWCGRHDRCARVTLSQFC